MATAATSSITSAIRPVTRSLRAWDPAATAGLPGAAGVSLAEGDPAAVVIAVAAVGGWASSRTWAHPMRQRRDAPWPGGPGGAWAHLAVGLGPIPSVVAAKERHEH